jgi:hypothetical protein
MNGMLRFLADGLGCLAAVLFALAIMATPDRTARADGTEPCADCPEGQICLQNGRCGAPPPACLNNFSSRPCDNSVNGQTMCYLTSLPPGCPNTWTNGNAQCRSDPGVCDACSCSAYTWYPGAQTCECQ